MALTMEHPDIDRLWRNRRRLAYLSFAMACFETVGLMAVALLGTDSMQHMGATVAWSYGLWGSITCAYIGFSAWTDVANARK